MRQFLSAAAVCAAGLLSVCFAGGAAAQTWFVYDGTCGVSGGASSCSSGGVTAQATAWGTTGTGGAFAQGQLASFGANGVGAYTGVNEGSSVGNNLYDNQHAFDSITAGCTAGTRDAGNTSTSTANGGCGGSQEVMLVNFSAKVNLSLITVGFCGNSPKECDVSILRWDGPSTGPNLATGGLTGWTLVGSQDLGGSGYNFNWYGADAYASTVSLGSQVSSWWMISTYFGGTTSTLDAGNDRFKVLSLGVNACSNGSGGNGGQYNNGNCTAAAVPTPGSLALAGVALMGLYAVRRKALRPLHRA